MVADNEFNHQIYELIRSKFFSPITMLKKLNQTITTEFIQEYYARINASLKENNVINY